MRIALLSDIHGNSIALTAVLRDARDAGVDRFCILGDLAAIGPEPVAAIESVASLDNAVLTRGNTDRYVVTGDGPPPSLAAARANPELVATYAGIAASLAWTRGFITGAGWFEWLEALPIDLRLALPDGTRLLGVHACPGNDDGEGIHPGRSNESIRSLVAGCDADLVMVGHTHEPMTRALDSTLVVNLGSVSNPRAPDLRASYVLLEAAPDAVSIEHRRVSYDHHAFLESVRRSRHPGADFILSYQRGEQVGRVPHSDHTPLMAGPHRFCLPAK